MTCEACGAQAKGRFCSECDQLKKIEDDVESGKFGDVVDDGRDYVRPGDCRAIVSSTGKQCENSPRDSGLCGNHEQARNVLTVDDVRGAPFADLRDELVDAGLNGAHAYRFATRFRDVSDLWNRLTALDQIEIGDHKYDADALATHAQTIAAHDELDVDDHPLAFENCIALTDSDKFDGRCVNGGYGTGLLCGTHKQANDPDTILDGGEPGPDLPRLLVEGGFADFARIEERGDDVIGVDLETYTVEKRPRDDFETDTTDTTMNEATTTHDDAQDQNDDENETRPPELDGVDEDDMIRVTLEDDDADPIDGEVYDTNVDDAETDETSVLVFFDGDDGEVYSIHARQENGEWDEVDLAREWLEDDGEKYDRVGTVADVEEIDPDEKVREELQQDDDWVDPFVFENRVGELTDVGLSEREAQVVALKEQGKTHDQAADFLTDYLEDRDESNSYPKSTVDEYSRRTRRKIREARSLVDETSELYE